MKTFFYWWVLVICLAACKKDKSEEGNPPLSSSSYIKGTIDGTAKTFNFSAAASKQDLGGGATSYSVFGKATGASGDYESFGFTLQTGNELVPGTYSEIDSTGTVALASVYNPNTTDATKIFSTQMDSTNPFEVTISDISDSIMTGTFKGKLLMNGDGSGSVTITAGDFKVKVQ